jgi:ABC-2 type transport system permease protein
MYKMWLIARHHFLQEASKRTFLLVLFSLPLFLAFALGMGFLASSLGDEDAVLGYVDEAGLLDQMPAASNDVQLAAFASRDQAQAALDAEEIRAYYVLVAGPPLQAELVYYEPPGGQATGQFLDAVRLNLLAGQQPQIVERLMARPEVTVWAVEAQREFSARTLSPGRLMPVIAAAVFAFLVLTTSGYVMQVTVTEKENRTMEVMVSSVSPSQLMGGKILGAVGIAASQLVVWLAFFVLVVLLGRGPLGIAWLMDLGVNWDDIAALLVVAVPAYFCLAAMMTLVGTTLVDSQEAQQAGGFFLIPLFVPLWLILPLAQNPNGPLALGLTFLPVTSVMALALRGIFVAIPIWQVLVASGVALVTGVFMVLLTARAFRLSMLRYGKRLRLSELLGQAG